MYQYLHLKCLGIPYYKLLFYSVIFYMNLEEISGKPLVLTTHSDDVILYSHSKLYLYFNIGL
jgi:hypothetical protein